MADSRKLDKIRHVNQTHNLLLPSFQIGFFQVQVSHYATISCRRLLRIGASGRRQERKPTLEEIEQARVCAYVAITVN